MEKLIKKAKSLSTITLIFAIFSLTWIFLDYLALRKIWEQNPDIFQFEWLMVTFSGVPLVILIFLVFFLVFYIFRINMKYKSELKKEKKLIVDNKKSESYGSETEKSE